MTSIKMVTAIGLVDGNPHKMARRGIMLRERHPTDNRRLYMASIGHGQTGVFDVGNPRNVTSGSGGVDKNDQRGD